MAALTPGLYPFGHRPDGREVKRIVISDGRLGAAILTQGAILQDVRLAGVDHGLAIGTDTLEPYLSAMRSCGSLIGPVINRISGGATEIGGQRVEFERNQDGRHTRHSGEAGTQNALWQIAERDDVSVTLELNLPDGAGGFPGNRAVAARYALVAEGVLEMRVAVTTDRDTIVNFANHGYWNLDGSDTYDGHHLQVAADRACVMGPDSLVTGEIEPVAGGPLDFRAGRVLHPGRDPRLDVNLCLADQRRALTEILTLTGRSGVSMTVSTTEPGVQLYDAANFADGGAPGHDGRANPAFCGLAIEPQGWPDACNHPHFPSIRLAAGRSVEQVTQWRFEGP
ncbi:aldose epimerase family protein [Mangrovicoccus algicola]|uniref:Galactose mutarotase n=1 Tax=Mangrovicoccus algicola TaxID=2771008 RepID=A0A8J6Z646_9RHOB|nr:aldose epimerase family protein [Mangrovicoccus algicola]MBE3638499.1 galactose mutarotase [Mangrovicoccus algicola]